MKILFSLTATYPIAFLKKFINYITFFTDYIPQHSYQISGQKKRLTLKVSLFTFYTCRSISYHRGIDNRFHY